MQEGFRKAVPHFDDLASNVGKLVQGANALGMPVRASEPLALGVMLICAGSSRLATPATHNAEPSGERAIPSGVLVTATCFSAPRFVRSTTLTVLLPMFAV